MNFHKIVEEPADQLNHDGDGLNHDGDGLNQAAAFVGLPM
jgi:hypothetical protein